MHILTVCPRCRTTYQVLQSLRGERIRCPKPQCRHVFTVGGESSPPGDGTDPQPESATPDRPQQSGTVGEMVPILPAEPAAPPVGRVRPAADEELPPAAPGENAEELPEVNDEETEPQPAPPLWQTTPPAVRKPPRPGAPPPGAAPTHTPSRPAPAPSWRDAPPPVRQPGAPTPQDKLTQLRRRSAAETVRLNRPLPTGRTPIEEPAGPEEPTPSSETVPAQEPMDDGSSIPLTDLQPPDSMDMAPAGSPIPESELAPRVGRKRAWMVILGLSAFVLIVLGSVGLIVKQSVEKGELEFRDIAMQAYRGGRFQQAKKAFEDLNRTFPNSEHVEENKFLADWCDLAARLHDSDADTGSAADQLVALLTQYKDNPALPAFGHDIGQALGGVAESFAQRNTEASSNEPLAVAARLEDAKTLLRKAAGSKALGDGIDGRIDTALANVRAAVERWERRNAVLARLKRLPGNAEGIRDARSILKEKDAVELKLPDTPEVKNILSSLEERHLDSVRKCYELNTNREPSPVGREKGPPSLVIDPLLDSSPGGAPPDDPVRLALARGVLYALRQSNGEVKWVRRVGIDTTALPEYVRRTAAHSDRYLVISSDSKTLTALDAEGNAVWEYRLDSPALGRPLKVDNLVYLPTYDGTVHEIEVARGVLLGRYKLGQHLTTGGAQEEGSSRLYFAADDSCVYVLDVSPLQKTCVQILYTGHPSGSLRSEPVIIPPVKLASGEATPGYLVLNQADGLDGVRLRVYELPLTDSHQEPLALSPEPRLEGWTWFRPRYDPETLGILSDRGRLGLFGIRQANNKDQALFPLLSPNGLDLTPYLGLANNALRPSARRGRSQIVYSQGNDFWVLAQGRLQRIGLAWSPQSGPHAAAGWKDALALGSPLHDSQVFEDPRHGQSTLFLVTQPLNKQMCMATAVDAAHGTVLWQRQLGLVCRGQPLELTPAGGGSPMVLALDQSGSLFALDPERFSPNKAQLWQSGGQNIAGAFEDNPRMPPVLLAAPDSHTAYEISCPGNGANLVVRQIECQAGPRRLLLQAERTVPLDFKSKSALSGAPALAGTPVIVGSWLILATGDGSFARLPLPLPETVLLESGPDWRGKDITSPDAKCYVAALGPDVFLATDGGRRLRCWQWGAAKDSYVPLPQDDPEAALELPDPIIAPPVALPAGGDLMARVCVADASHTLSLVSVRKSGEQRVSRTWDLGGTLTNGPFLRTLPNGQLRIGCVIQDKRLVWIDPNREGKSWEYSASRAIAGSPEVIDNLVVVADLGGRVVGLDPLTGHPCGRGPVLHGSAIPVASPVPFGPGWAFVPACDGTVVLLTLGQMLQPLRNPPFIW